MNVGARLRKLFMLRGRAKNFKERLLSEHDLLNFLYSTGEGLLIFGTYTAEENELKAAKIPELLKALKNMHEAEFYQIRAGERFYYVGAITRDVVFFGEGKKPLTLKEFEKIRDDTKQELKL